ncbi:MAG: PUA domain-containing protein [Halobacteriota archaeon]|nr:PUA domain-containing protein [Halobacteriota archaeon]
MNRYLKRVRTIADYQFGKGAGNALFSDETEFTFSTTGRVRQILQGERRIATLRAKDGLFTLSIEGARRLHTYFGYPRMRVVLQEDASSFAREGKNAFARHVVDVDPEIRAYEEVIVVDKNDELLATGRANLCADEMVSFDRGVAVDVRVGVAQKRSQDI